MTQDLSIDMIDLHTSHVPSSEMYEVVRILEACNAARQRGPVALDDVATPLKGSLV